MLQRSGSSRPTREQIATMLAKGTVLKEIVYGDLTGDGHDEAFVATTPPGSDAQASAIVIARDRRGRYAPVLQRILAGEGWLPIQIGRPGDDGPVVAVFSSQGASSGALSYVVVQSLRGILQTTLERSAIPGGRIRFVPEGLLETRGDVDRIYRWAESAWQTEDLPAQYLPPLPPQTATIQYTIDPVRGPFLEGPRSLRLRVGQRIFLRRMDTGEPSRILFEGGASSLSFGPDGVITLLQPGQVEINIEGPAYSGKTATLLLRIDP